MATTLQPVKPSPPESLGAGGRFIKAWRSFFLPGDIITLCVAFGLLLMPALSLNAAGWKLSMGILIPTLFFSIAVGFLVSRSRYNELFALLMSLIYGSCIVLIIAALNQPAGFMRGLYDVVYRTVQWVIDAFTNGINQDDLVFTLIVSGLCWFLGFNLAWHLFRVNRVWRAILPPGLIIIVNGVYYTGENNLQPYLIGYVFLSLLLIMRSNLEARHWDWFISGVRVPARVRRQVYIVGAVLALIALAAWLIPTTDIQQRLTRFQEFLAAEPLQQFAELWNRLFESAETQGPATTDYYGSDSLELGGAIRLGDEVTLYVTAPPQYHYYWRSRVFDSYDNGRWTSAPDTRLTDLQPPLTVVQSPAEQLGRVQVEQEFTIGLRASRLVYTAPQPLEVSLATRTDLRYTPDQAMIVAVIRPAQVLRQGDSYTAISAISTATAEQLRNAGTDYPQYIRDLYPPYIPSATGRTIQLAQQIVAEAGAATPYDAAKAIETWLRMNIVYDERIPEPPPGQDPVDWVLFDWRRGYCNYYASSMVVMLRTLGIPARMAAGFAQGTYHADQNAFVVREHDAHTWVEVYFPGYGWVEFEPTAAQEPINRGDALNLPPPILSSATPQTPTATFTMPPSPTPQATEALPTATAFGDEAVQENIPASSTPTPEPSPTPTPVPAVVPTPPPPNRPQREDFLSFLLPSLGIGLVFLLLIGIFMLVVLYIYWWWEWRGMRGLSPAARAYAKLERYLPLIGIHLRQQQTPDERRRIVAGALPAVEPPVTAITSLYSAERYGPPREQDEIGYKEIADEAWADTREGILRRWLRRVLMPWKRG